MTDTDSEPTEPETPSPLGQQPVWAMDRVEKWIEGGCKADDPLNFDHRLLKALEAERLIEIHEKGKKLVTLTLLGKYEADRLNHLLSTDQ